WHLLPCQKIAYRIGSQTQRRKFQKESSDGPVPILFLGNLGSPGNQPGAPLSIWDIFTWIF
ncbi:hypothetical protein PS029_21095, partial [Yersinia pestis]|nr:hypothetical protein [Yersinia pestis]